MSERPEKIYSDAQAKIDGGGLRYDQGKTRYDLVPPEWEHALAEVLTVGAQKYADRNWERGMPWSKMVGCARRHIWKWLRGDSFDAETGCHHLAHAAWNLLALMSYQLRAVGENDLPKPVMHPTKILAPDVQRPPPSDPSFSPVPVVRGQYRPDLVEAFQDVVNFGKGDWRTHPEGHDERAALSPECLPRLQQVEPAGDQHPLSEVFAAQDRVVKRPLGGLITQPVLPRSEAAPQSPSPWPEVLHDAELNDAHDDGA